MNLPIQDESQTPDDKQTRRSSHCSAALGVWTVDDEMWFIAESEEEALSWAKSVCDIEADDVGFCSRLTAKELEGIRYYDDIYERTGERSFLEQVGKLVIDGEWEPGVFATADI